MFDGIFRRFGGSTNRSAPLRLSSAEIIDKLHFARSVGKRLDEHREVVEAIERETTFFHEPHTKWHLGHMATQDDYLMRLYYIAHGCWPDDVLAAQRRPQPTGEYVRPRPAILGPCGLPEYPIRARAEAANA